jgi:hypothetical protein
MSIVYKGFRVDLLAGNVTAAADVRVLAVMAGSTAPTDEDAVTLADIATQAEFDGAGYTRIDLANVAVAADDVNDRHQVTYDPASFGVGVGGGSDPVIGLLYYRRVDGTPANDVAWAYNDSGGFPIDPSGGAFDLTPGPLHIG